jgi:ribosomal protein S18 acetylase RimI-like enzyme
MINYSLLENTDIEALHKTFVNAFSDYQVKIDLPLWKFRNMLLRRGYNSQISMGAFENGELVGFVLNGLRNWNGKLTAYDVGTGVIGKYRKQGITGNLIQNIKEMLKEAEVKQYLLEVIKSNTAAFELYKKSGFKIIREFKCFKLDKSNHIPDTKYKVEHIEKIELNDWEKTTEFWDFKPSWQNSVDSINAVDTLCYSIVRLDNAVVGYGVIDKKTGDIAQIAVDKNYRRKGIAGSIISDLINSTESNKISILNVDDQCKSMLEFLHDLGFEDSVGQYEMVLNL